MSNRRTAKSPAPRKASRNPTAKPRRRPAPARAARQSRTSRSHPSLFGRLRWRTKVRLAMGGLLVAGAVWAWQSGFVQRQYDDAVSNLYAYSGDAGLKLANVHVYGREHTAPEDILEAVGLEQGDPLLDFDPHATRARLEVLPWVMEATVERRLPDLIYVTLVERRPLALWQLDGHLSVIDQQGEVISDAYPEDFTGLPMIVGAGAAEAAEALFVLLATEPELASQVTAAVRVGNRRWNLRFEHGIDVRLPEEGAVEAWQTLARLDRDESILSRDIVVIDLRQPDRLLVRPSPDVVVEPSAPPVAGEET